MNTQTTYADKSLLTIIFLFCNSSLSLSTQQVSSASHCSVILLFFCLLYHSALLLFYRSALLLLYCFALHFITFWTSSIMSHHACPSYCLILFPFRTANQIQSHSYSFIQATLTIPLPLPIGNTRTSVLAIETLTDLSSSVHFS
jgi:hypothetical protein